MKLPNIENEIMNNTNISRKMNIQFYLKSNNGKYSVRKV